LGGGIVSEIAGKIVFYPGWIHSAIFAGVSVFSEIDCFPLYLVIAFGNYFMEDGCSNKKALNPGSRT